MGDSTSWNPQGLSRLVMVLLYFLQHCVAKQNLMYMVESLIYSFQFFNSSKTELNSICHLLALLEVHHILHVSRIRVKYKF